jgi:hypothetical protein
MYLPAASLLLSLGYKASPAKVCGAVEAAITCTHGTSSSQQVSLTV